MISAVLAVSAFISTILFPWPLTILLTIAAAASEPLIPLAVGLFADTLYFAPSASLLPLYTLLGAALTALAFFVRTRLNTGSIKR